MPRWTTIITLQHFFIYTYTNKYIPGEICKSWNVFCQLQMYKWQCSHFHQSTDRLQEMVLKGFFGHILKGVMFLTWKLVNQRNKTYVLLGVQQNVCFQNQPQDYT